MTPSRLIVTLLPAILLSGCAYKEPPASDPAVVTLFPTFGATVTSIDGKKIDPVQRLNGEQIVHLTPGHHNLTIHTFTKAGTANWDVPLTLDPSHLYSITPTSQGAISLRISDRSGGRVLAE